MTVLPLLENGLFALGQVLRLPVMVLLWVCVAAALFMAGSCLLEFVARTRERRRFDIKRWLNEGAALASDDGRRRRLPVPLRQFLSDIDRGREAGTLGHGGLEHLLLEREEQVRHTTTSARLLVKVGPSLGLLGTLIPMGTSLAAMATGNLEAMAGQMVVAFTTTIIGLSAGTLAYVVAVARQTWATELVREQRFLAERVAAELGDRELVDELARKVG